MLSYIIATDSTADLPDSYIASQEIPVVNLTYTIKGVSYGHGQELPYKEFYNLMREGNIPSTSQVNPEEAKEALLDMLKINNNILYLAFSSGLSGTYNSVRLAAEEIMEENSDANIIVIDTLAASMGEGIVVYLACKMREEGKTMEETANWVKENIPHFVHLFTVDDLNHLYRGGRVTKTAAFVGTVLNIKPVLHVNDEGKLIPLKKIRGRKNSLMTLVDDMGEHMGSFKDKNQIFFISHGDCIDDAELVKNEIISRYGIKDSMINVIGPTIGAHAGPGTVALFFLGDYR